MKPGPKRGVPHIPRPPYNPSTHAFCTHCREVKPRGEFPKNKNAANGLHQWCSTCNNASIARWENDPKNWRHRRDMQAINSRRHQAIKHGRAPKQGPVLARYSEPPHMRAQAAS